jgi:hypothetical protein
MIFPEMVKQIAIWNGIKSDEIKKLYHELRYVGASYLNNIADHLGSNKYDYTPKHVASYYFGYLLYSAGVKRGMIQDLYKAHGSSLTELPTVGWLVIRKGSWEFHRDLQSVRVRCAIVLDLKHFYETTNGLIGT